MKNFGTLFWSFILNIISQFKFFLLGQFVVALTWAIDMSLRPYLVKTMLNILNLPHSSEVLRSLIFSSFFYFFISCLMVVLLRFYDWNIASFHPVLKKYISLNIIERLIDHPQSFYQQNFSGTIANKINDVTNAIPTLLSIIIDRFFSHIMALLIAVYAVWTVDYKFALALIVWIILFLGISIIFSKKAKTLSNESAKARSTVIGYIVDIISNVSSVRFFSMKGSEIKSLDSNYNNYVSAEKSRGYFVMTMHTYQELTFIIYQFICMCWLISGIRLKTCVAGDFALIFILNISIINCLQSLSNDLRTFSETIGNLIQGLSVINPCVEIKDQDKAVNLTVKEGIIIFDKVKFSYIYGQLFFNNISLTIYPGQKIGLIGYSGAGKTTFVSLILRLFELTEGQISIDYQNIKTITQESLRKAIGIIPQDISIFNRSVKENIRYGRIDATDEEVIVAAKMAYADEFISRLPNGYNTLLGERGSILSGGERQRIAIARIYLKNPAILILDEATSNLDSVTEIKIQESLQSIMRGKTSIVIAHRLSTLVNMDRILVFDNGKIVQDGNHFELVSRKGLYKILWDSQLNGFLPNKSD